MNPRKNSKISKNLFIAKPCESGGAYDVSLSGPGEQKINMESAAKKLSAAGFKARVVTPYISVLARGKIEMSVYRSGKLLIKGARDEEEVKEIASEVYSLV